MAITAWSANVVDQLDLFVGERPQLDRAVVVIHADRRVPFAEGQDENAPVRPRMLPSLILGACSGSVVASSFDMDDLLRRDGSSRARVTLRSRNGRWRIACSWLAGVEKLYDATL